MDAQEMLNVLDIIRNEEIYTERLNVLKKAEQEFNDARYIAETVKQAQRVLEQAEDKRKEYNDLLDQAEVEINKKYDKVLAEVLRDREAVKLELENVARLKELCERQLEMLEKERKELKEEKDDLQRLRGLAQVDQERANELSRKVSDKFEQVRMIING